MCRSLSNEIENGEVNGKKEQKPRLETDQGARNGKQEQFGRI
jgi:hypothetical protein